MAKCISFFPDDHAHENFNEDDPPIEDSQNLPKTDQDVGDDAKLADTDIMNMRRPKDDVFKPAQVIDYQNKSLRSSRWDDIDIITPAKVVDYGHKKPVVPIVAPEPLQADYLQPATSIDYGHTSANRKQMDSYDNRRESRFDDRNYEPPSKRWQDNRGQPNSRWNQNVRGGGDQFQRGGKSNFNPRQNERDGHPTGVDHWNQGKPDNKNRNDNYDSNKIGEFLFYKRIWKLKFKLKLMNVL